MKLLTELIQDLEKNPMDEIGIGVRSVQIARLKFKDSSCEMEEAYREVLKGREVACRYNDIKTIIRSYLEEAYLLKKEQKYMECMGIYKTAVKLASDSNHFALMR